MPADPTIVCPRCQAEIKVTESLAAPLIAAAKKQFEERLARQETDLAKREAELRSKQTQIEKERESMDEQIAARLKTERAALVETERQKAREAVRDEFERLREEKSATEALIKDRDAKLAEARRNELELRKDRERLQEERAQFDLDKQRAIDAERSKIRESAQKEADEQSRLRLAEKDKTITDLQTRLQDALRKAEQGSQQLQGEIQELELEALLRSEFPHDAIEPVPKGEFGGDVLQRVVGPLGRPCGLILWESKRTKKWSPGWLAKLREDQRTAQADVAILASQELPVGIETFGLVEGVWVASFRCALAVAALLRHSIIELHNARAAQDGQQTKMELVYDYLTGPRFRHRVQAIVEKFTDMRDDLEKERRVMMKNWSKREEQIRGVIDSTAGFYGDLQGIAGRGIQEIPGLSLPAGETEAAAGG